MFPTQTGFLKEDGLSVTVLKEWFFSIFLTVKVLWLKEITCFSPFSSLV